MIGLGTYQIRNLAILWSSTDKVFTHQLGKTHLNRTIQYARNIIEIPDHDMVIINHSRKSLIFNENGTWIKREGSEDFYFIMGSNDGAEISELVRLLMLSKLVH